MDENLENKKYKILVFSWNTESVSIGETLNDNIYNYNRTSTSTYVPGLTTWRYEGDKPDFYPKFASIIKEKRPDIIVIGFQEDRHPGSYFHSHLLPEEMPKIGYSLLKRTKLMGVGVTTCKGLTRGDIFERGIRVSIYVKHNLKNIIDEEEKQLRDKIGNDGQIEYICSSKIIRGKGATCSYLMLPKIGCIAIVCCHLPFNGKSLINERVQKNKMVRQNELNRCNICFNNIIENVILGQNPIPNAVIYFGDFNYRISDMRSASDVAKDFNIHWNDNTYLSTIYNQYDELLEQMKRDNIYTFNEGIDNTGPLFLPTCKMIKGRNNSNNDECIDSWQIGKQNHRIPSWCDRILYKTNDNIVKLDCELYDRFDHGEIMKKSDHAGVISIINVSSNYVLQK